jgi:asparagine synthase (glutamine-hydrolysing)
MCGICGVAGHVDGNVLRAMTDSLTHRGPDDSGFHAAPGIALGVRRLSIIDVPGGHQPIANEDGSVTVVFNGEIYNHQELRGRLEARGHRFATRTDTEVLVHLYEEYGDALVHLLQGMFAFALWDDKRRRLLLARDRLGIKPLYYTEANGAFLFASEVKALLEHPDVHAAPDLEALDLYLTFRYVPGPATLFKGIKKLPPGHTLVVANGHHRIDRYWELVLGDYQPGARLDETVEEFAALLQETTRRHLISDVPVGVLLSGGIDSSVVAALAASTNLHQPPPSFTNLHQPSPPSTILHQPPPTSTPFQSFTVGFDLPGAHNELEEARTVARHLGTDHHELVLTPDAAALLPRLVRHLDEPIADPAVLPTYLICEFARARVPVVLTGEGGDELLAGYPRYIWFDRARRLQRAVPRWLRQTALAASRLTPIGARYHRALDNVLAERTDVERHLHWVAGLAPELRAELAPHVPRTTHHAFESYLTDSPGGAVHRLMALDMRTWLVDDVLTKMDKMSMAVSVEARVPFLDHRLVEFVAGVPLAIKLAHGPKTLLKRAAAPLLPATTVRRRKHAFQIPLEPWLAGPLSSFVREVLLDGPAQQRGWFDTRQLEKMLCVATATDQPSRAMYFSGYQPRIDGQSIWTLLCLELWAREFLD